MASKQYSLTINQMIEAQACALAAKTGQVSVQKYFGDRPFAIVLKVLKDSVITELNFGDCIGHDDG